jgi:putative hydrolase of the HAD superfamily
VNRKIRRKLEEDGLGLRAVVFDYGMVLTGPRDPEIHDAMVRLTGLPLDRFEDLYWADRHAYDEGKLSGLAFFQKLSRDGDIHLTEAQIDEMLRLDGKMWSTVNERMVNWQRSLKEHGLLTGILSNMGDSVLEVLLATHAWIGNFDSHVWSYQLRIAKPDPAIYHHALSKLGVRAEEALFVDDKHENIVAARAVGMKAIQFSTADRLREEMVAANLSAGLPLP